MKLFEMKLSEIFSTYNVMQCLLYLWIINMIIGFRGPEWSIEAGILLILMKLFWNPKQKKEVKED